MELEIVMMDIGPDSWWQYSEKVEYYQDKDGN